MKKICLCLFVLLLFCSCGKKSEVITLYCDAIHFYDENAELEDFYSSSDLGAQDTRLIIDNERITFEYYVDNEPVTTLNGSIKDCKLDEDDYTMCDVLFEGSSNVYKLAYTTFDDYCGLTVVNSDGGYVFTFGTVKQESSGVSSNVDSKVPFDQTDAYKQMEDILYESLKDYDVHMEYSDADKLVKLVVKFDSDISYHLKNNYSTTKPLWDNVVSSFNNTGKEGYNVICNFGYEEVGFSIIIVGDGDVAYYGSLNGDVVYNVADDIVDNSQSNNNNYYVPFTNKYGTSTTMCHHSGCNNYIASSGDTWDCVSHAGKCLNCGQYIDCDAMYCMSCLTSSVPSSSFTNKYGTATTKCHHSGCNNYIASSGDTWDCVSHANVCLNCLQYIDCDAMYCMSCLTGK